MDNQIEQNMQMLLANMSTYYQEEINLYNNRIDYIINEIDSIKYINKKEEIYLVSLIISETRLLIINAFDDNMIISLKKVQRSLDSISSLESIDKLTYTLNSLKRNILNYKHNLEEFFYNRILLTNEELKIDAFVSRVFNTIKKCKYDINFTEIIIKNYIKHLNGNDDILSIENTYKKFLSSFRHFVKSKNLFKKSIPLKDNPITQLLQLVHFSRNKVLSHQCICKSDYIFLKAYFESINDLDSVNIINELHSILFIPTKYQTLQIALDDNSTIKQLFEYETFAISHYFYDFDINYLLFNGKSETENKTKNNFADFFDELASLPNKLISTDKIYSEINRKYSFYDMFIGTTPYDTYNNSPAKILFDISNLYFHNNIKTATHINVIISKDGISYYKKFETLFQKTIDFINTKNHINNTKFSRHIQEFSSFLLLFDSIYKQASLCEDDLLISVKKNNLSFIKIINQSYKSKNYKKIIEESIVSRSDTSKKLGEIDNLIDSSKYNQAAIITKELVFDEIENIYYKIPIIVKFDELPPVSHKIAELLNNTENGADKETIDLLIESNENYWSI